MSIENSRREKNISIYLEVVDQLGKTLLRRIEGLLRARPDEDWADLGRAIKRGPSWMSEFKNGRRTTNDLRMLVKMAKFFAVPTDYLLNEASAQKDDPSGVQLLGAWNALESERDRFAVLRLALALARTEPEELP